MKEPEIIVTHLKPVKEYKKISFCFYCWETIDEIIERVNKFKEELEIFKKEGWEGVENGYSPIHSGDVLQLYKTHFVDDKEYNDKITLALQNKPSWEDAPEGAESLGIAIWECDYQYEWVWFYHKDPLNVVFAENKPPII